MADVVVQAQSSLFQRQGTTLQQKAYSLPIALANYIASAYIYSALSSSLGSAEQNALYGILTQDTTIIPGGLTLYNIQSMVPELFPGAAELQLLYELDPFSSTYETFTQALYDRAYSTARAAALSGPANIRGGTARQGFELAELGAVQSINRFREVWHNQLAVAQLVIAAVQLTNTVEAERRNEQLKAQQLQAGTEQGRTVQILSAAEQLVRDREAHVRTLAAGAEFLGVPIMKSDEALQGQGFQSGMNTGFGMSYWK